MAGSLGFGGWPARSSVCEMARSLCFRTRLAWGGAAPGDHSLGFRSWSARGGVGWTTPGVGFEPSWGGVVALVSSPGAVPCTRSTNSRFSPLNSRTRSTNVSTNAATNAATNSATSPMQQK